MIHSKLQICMLIAGYFTYLLVGAWIFQVLERDAERKQQASVLRMKEDFLKNFTSLSPVEVEIFVTKLMEAVRMGMDLTGQEHSNWDFSNSFFFVGSTLSTIGYGNLSPKTAGGQLFCVVFAGFGIPLNIVFLHHIGKILSLLCERLAKCLYTKGVKKKTTRVLTLLFFLVMGILVFLCVPSLIFQVMEDWTYSEAIYFAFITLSTIGFGDYIIGRQHNKRYFPYYRILVAIWIIFGLAWIALLFNLLTNLLEDSDTKPIEEFIPVKTETRKNRKSKRCPPTQFPLEDGLSLHPCEDGQENQLQQQEDCVFLKKLTSLGRCGGFLKTDQVDG
ncbi:potassium channel subfamily K member 16-like [Eublepharis macularius]|uniref:Potassium channel subfamily K member 16-like n=1 Tax=Eublepharis macularius TaxID=481883 RepID=A0AA97IZQ4_EUBMA|nr:potassium channel subfamily K member 16-like [Eublepharis macularius]